MSNVNRARHEIEESIASCVHKRGLLPRAGTPVVAMVSGGCDSVALLRAVCALHEELELGPVRIVHVNHMIRGADADADEEFVRALCTCLDVPLSVHHVDIPALVEATHGNLENVARLERYRIADEELDALCDDAGAHHEDGRIFVAHTASDRAETFFMRAIAGAGSGSLSSISYLNGRIARPLLDLTRTDLEAYLEDLGPCISGTTKLWCEDATNTDTDHFRAHVRANVMPAARVFNPRLEETLGRTLDILHDEDAYLAGVAGTLEKALLARTSDDAVQVDAAGLSALPRALARRVVRDAARMVVPADVRIDNWHVESVLDGVANPAFSLDLPTGANIRNEYGKLTFLRAGNRNGTDDKGAPIGWLGVPGTLELPDGTSITAELVDTDVDVRSATSEEAYVDVAECDRLYVTYPEPGLRMRPFGMGEGTKKVARVLIDDKVPERLRGSIPVVRTGDGPDDEVVWLVGIRADNRFRVTDDTVRVVHLTHG